MMSKTRQRRSPNDLVDAFRKLRHGTVEQLARFMNSNAVSLQRTLRTLRVDPKNQVHRKRVILTDNKIPYIYWQGKPNMDSNSPRHEYDLTALAIVQHEELSKRGLRFEFHRDDLEYPQFGFKPDEFNIIHFPEKERAGFEELERSAPSQGTIRSMSEERKYISSRITKAKAFLDWRDWNRVVPERDKRFPVDDAFCRFTFLHSHMADSFLEECREENINTRAIWVTDLQTRLDNPLGTIWRTPKDYRAGKLYSLID